MLTTTWTLLSPWLCERKTKQLTSLRNTQLMRHNKHASHTAPRCLFTRLPAPPAGWPGSTGAALPTLSTCWEGKKKKLSRTLDPMLGLLYAVYSPDAIACGLFLLGPRMSFESDWVRDHPKPWAVCSSQRWPPVSPFISVQLYLLAETTWVNGSVRPLEWIKVAFNYLHDWPHEAG